MYDIAAKNANGNYETLSKGKRIKSEIPTDDKALLLIIVASNYSHEIPNPTKGTNFHIW